VRRFSWVALAMLAACGSPPPPNAPPRPRPTHPAPSHGPGPSSSPTPDPTGTRDAAIATVVGTGQPGVGSDHGNPLQAALNTPSGVAINRGDLLIADTGNHRIRRLTYDGDLSTYVGTGQPGNNGDGANLTQLQLNAPAKVVSDDASGLVFIADTGNQMIRCVDPSHHLITVAGGGATTLVVGAAPIAGLNARLQGPTGMAFDSGGNLYVCESAANRILKLDASHEWKIGVYAGTSTAGFGGDQGPALQARFNHPADLAVDSQDNLYIADTGNNRIRKIGPDGTVSTVAGNGLIGFFGDGRTAEAASFTAPSGVAVDNLGDLFVADTGNQRIRVVRADGTVATLAGTGASGYAGDGGLPASASFRTPLALAYNPSGGLYVVDQGNHCVRRFNLP